MAEGVSRESLEVVPFEEKADFYVINTCTVTDNADQESRRWVRKAKKSNPSARIIVTGCYAQTNPEEVKKIPGIHLVLGNQEKMSLSTFIPKIGWKPKEGDPLTEPLSCVGEIRREKIFSQPILESFFDKTRAFLKIQDGCNAWCSFCIIPKARGRSRSFWPGEVISQIQAFEKSGYKEVVLSGINLGAYGLDFRPKYSLLQLFNEIVNNRSTISLRFSSIEPDLFSGELVSALTGSSRVCRHFHIPLQSGSEEILKKMSRKYSPDDYRRLLLSIHQASPDSAIGADIMVGFPGETEKDFEKSLKLVEELPLSYLHVFPYSAREGTEAFNDPEPLLPDFILKERAETLRKAGKRKGEAFRAKFIGRRLKVIVEAGKGSHGSHEDQYGIGLSDNYIKVLIQSGKLFSQNESLDVMAVGHYNDKLIVKTMC